LSLIRKHGLLHGSIGAFAEVCRTLRNETGRATRPGHRATSVPLLGFHPLESALPPRPTPFTAPRAEPCSAARALHALLVVSDLRAVAPTVRPPPARRAKVELGQQRTRSACCSAFPRQRHRAPPPCCRCTPSAGRQRPVRRNGEAGRGRLELRDALQRAVWIH
jgi:hypothetical protein